MRQHQARGSARHRELYGMSFTWRQSLAFDAAVRAIRTARRLTSGPLARGWNTSSFEMVAQTEEWRIKHGRPTPQVREDGAAGISLPETRQAAS